MQKVNFALSESEELKELKELKELRELKALREDSRSSLHRQTDRQTDCRAEAASPQCSMEPEMTSVALLENLIT